MRISCPVFVCDEVALEKKLCFLKCLVCPFCKRPGTLNRHSRVQGNDPESYQGLLARGQRAFCSNRGRRAGCGRTFPILLCRVLPRHTFTAPLLWKALKGLLNGFSIKAAWEAADLSMALDSFYHLLQRLRRRLDIVRVTLSALSAPPSSSARNPLVQTLEHLQWVFGSPPCPPEAFQLRLQRPLMG